ncbi:MAG: acetyl-CoA carboxylase carboxyl transferase subunit alpha [Tenericutes bacterium HGW-Tenericutes-1]|nr:MAG: acetyl-CoA carboxylase carboxyl transferase subunit alpha [Tenericutes bacterium HGW-Tenericutes-1]
MDIQNSAWEIVRLARHPKRPTSKTVIKELFPDFIELHGDRLYGDDPSIIGGISSFLGQPITIIAQEKGTTTEDKIYRNFGMAHPEGYRKALRLMKQAEKYNRPIFCIIDTPGAYPGIGAEERGQAGAIALNLREMSRITVPIIAVVLSEGGSGGALGIGVGDSVAMFENSIYSILSPEGFASILYKDSSKAAEAASLMKLTAADLYQLEIIDAIFMEEGGLHISYQSGFNHLKSFLTQELNRLSQIPQEKLLEKRYLKYRKLGQYHIN